MEPAVWKSPRNTDTPIAVPSRTGTSIFRFANVFVRDVFYRTDGSQGVRNRHRQQHPVDTPQQNLIYQFFFVLFIHLSSGISKIRFRHICRLIMEPPERRYHRFPVSLITDNRITGRMIHLRRTDMFHAVKIILKHIGFPVRHILLCNMKTNSAPYFMFNHKFHFLPPALLFLLHPQLPVPQPRSRGLR